MNLYTFPFSNKNISINFLKRCFLLFFSSQFYQREFQTKCISNHSSGRCWKNPILRNILKHKHPQFTSVQSLSHVQLFATPGTAARQTSLSITNSWNLPKLMSIESMMPSNHLILCCTLLLPPSIFPSIRVFSNKSVLCIRWLKYWSFSINITPSNEYSGLISFRIDWFDLLAVHGTLKSLLQHHSSKASILQHSASHSHIHM